MGLNVDPLAPNRNACPAPRRMSRPETDGTSPPPPGPASDWVGHGAAVEEGGDILDRHHAHGLAHLERRGPYMWK